MLTRKKIPDNADPDNWIEVYDHHAKQKLFAKVPETVSKKLYKKVICPKNKRYVPALKKCVIKTAGEKMRKRKAMKRAAMKKRGKMAKIIRKRKKSMKKRKAFGLRRR